MLLEVCDTKDRDAAIERLTAVLPHAVDGATMEEMTDGCSLLDVIEDGQTVGAVAVELGGDEATITAAASCGEATYRALELVEEMLRRKGVKRIAIDTKRTPLVHRLWNIGYRIEKCRMTKDLNHGR